MNRNYTLRDWEYFELLKILVEGLDLSNIDYALVGGGATQAHIASILSKAHRTTIPKVPGLDLILRPTKDLDITSRASSEGFANYFANLQHINEPHIEITPKQSRKVQISYKGRNRHEPVTINMNYQTGPQDFAGLDDHFYNECINSARKVDLSYRNEKVSVKVASPVCVITSKLTRSNSKDTFDISNLLNVIYYYGGGLKSFDFDKVREYLMHAGKPEIYGRLEEIRAQVIKH